METKTCTKCGEVKALSEFGKRTKRGKPGLYAKCKPCVNQDNKDWRDANPEIFKATQRKNNKKNSKKNAQRVREWRARPGNMDRKNAGERERRKAPDVRAKNNAYNNEWLNRPGIREAMNAKDRLRRKEDPEYRQRQLDAQREYYSRPEIVERERAKRKILYSTQEWRDKFNARRRERYATDPDFLCGLKLRAMVVRTHKKAKTSKNLDTKSSLGYSPHQLRLRIEFQFKDGMSWSNYGDWHIDHKKPIAAFLAQGITDPKTVNALCNLQPMWAEENQMKSSKWVSLLADNDNVKREHKSAA